MSKYRIYEIETTSELSEILSAISDSSKTLGLTPAITSKVDNPVGGLIWLLRKDQFSGHLEVIFDPGPRELTVAPVTKDESEWTGSHAQLVAEYLSDRLGGKLAT